MANGPREYLAALVAREMSTIWRGFRPRRTPDTILPAWRRNGWPAKACRTELRVSEAILIRDRGNCQRIVVPLMSLPNEKRDRAAMGSHRQRSNLRIAQKITHKFDGRLIPIGNWP
jgi:hypothetical protein